MTLPYDQRPYRPGVGALIVGRDGDVFVAKRSDTAIEAWQLPQGGIKKSEDPAAAVLREVEEETGTDKVTIVARAVRWLRYDVPVDLADLAWKGRWRGQEQMWFALRFDGVDADIKLNKSGKPEFNAWRWEPLMNISALAPAFKQPLYGEIIREFAPVVAALRSGART